MFFYLLTIDSSKGFIPRRIFDCGQTFGKAADPQTRCATACLVLVGLKINCFRINFVQNMRERHWRKGPAFIPGRKPQP